MLSPGVSKSENSLESDRWSKSPGGAGCVSLERWQEVVAAERQSSVLTVSWDWMLS